MEDPRKVEEICPTCSGILRYPRNLLQDGHKHLLFFLIRMLDCEIETFNGTFNVCIKCEAILVRFATFKFNCEKSIEKFRRIISDEEVAEKTLIFYVKEDKVKDNNSEEKDSILKSYLVQDAPPKESRKVALNAAKNARKRSKSPVFSYKPSKQTENKSPQRSEKHKKASVKAKSLHPMVSPRLCNLDSEKPSDKTTPALLLKLQNHLDTKAGPSKRLGRFPRENCIHAYRTCMEPFFATRQCPICLMCMMNRHRLAQHISKMHNDFREMWCPKCNTIEENISEHNVKEHNGNRRLFTCLLCDRSLATAPEIRCHIERHAYPKMKRRMKAEWLVCENCPDIFNNAKELSEHVCSNAPVEVKQQELATLTEPEETAPKEPKEVVDRKRVVPKRPRVFYDKYPYEEVDRALRETMGDFYRNRKCPICGLITANLNLLKLHILGDIHKDVRETWCYKCNILVDNLTKHNEEHSADVFFCKFCKKDFDDRAKLKLHIVNHSETTFETVRTAWFICKLCPEAFPYEEELQQHNITCEEIKKDVAAETFEGNCNSGANRERRPSALAVRSCPLCKAQVRYLAMHIKKMHIIGTGKKRKAKRVVKKYFTAMIPRCKVQNSNNLSQENEKGSQSRSSEKNEQVAAEKTVEIKKKMGRPVSTREKLFLCNVCGYKAKTITRLNNHLRIHAGIKPFQCSLCDKCFTTDSSRREHETRHLGNRPFACDICGKKYVSKSEVRMHKAMHVIKPQKCFFCNKEFCRPQLLKMHMKKHTDADKFPCDQCDAKFHLNRLLTRHVIDAHTTERPYQCDFCPRAFKYVEHLKEHNMTHSGVKPYSCSICSFSANKPWSLKLHMRRHPEDAPQENNPHNCEYCYKCFSTNAMLMSHTRNVHQQLLKSPEKRVVDKDYNGEENDPLSYKWGD